MDGIIGIEGAGPGAAGKIKKAGFIGASSCAFSLDAACLEVIKTNPRHILTHRLGVERKLFSGNVKKNKELPQVSFQLPKGSALEGILNRIIPGLAFSKPFLNRAQCTRCGFCAKACPAGAITLKPYPVFDFKKCIYCFCCHENCPEAAISLKENILFKIFKAMGNEKS
ncbi:MAG: 4Fe-4S binding protein [Spirochaetales bacterium]|nr:4Fe-4S binding protein [Spirochaetales bacterium]